MAGGVRRIRVLGLGLALLAGVWLLRTLQVGGVFTRVEPHFDGTCEPVPGVVGGEDLTVHPGTGVAYVSSADRAALLRGEPPRGALLALDLRTDPPTVRNLTPDAAADFHPHGLSLWVGADGRDVLFVVNHAGGRHTIEVYDLVGGRLVHRATHEDPLLVSPNDVLGVGPDRFYVTNDHGSAAGLGRALEEWLRLPRSRVVYFDGERFAVTSPRLRMANGIQASADGRTIFVAATLGRTIHVFDRNPDSGALELRTRIRLDSGPDNIERDAEGALWIGAHPRLLALVSYMSGRAERAPSQVLRVSPEPAGRWRVEEILADDGTRLSGASVAARHGDRLVLGAILDDHLLVCRPGTAAAAGARGPAIARAAARPHDPAATPTPRPPR